MILRNDVFGEVSLPTPATCYWLDQKECWGNQRQRFNEPKNLNYTVVLLCITPSNVSLNFGLFVCMCAGCDCSCSDNQKVVPPTNKKDHPWVDRRPFWLFLATEFFSLVDTLASVATKEASSYSAVNEDDKLEKPLSLLLSPFHKACLLPSINIAARFHCWITLSILNPRVATCGAV